MERTSSYALYAVYVKGYERVTEIKPGFCGPGPDACGRAWPEHGEKFVGEWLNEFFWRDAPLSRFIESIKVSFQKGPFVTLWRSSTPCQELPKGDRIDGLPSLDDAQFNMWHPVWPEFVESWHLSGKWLHPETYFSIDQKAFAESNAHLLVGCRDREDPYSPRRYDPDRNPMSHDQGVIAFPIRTLRSLDFYEEGYCPEASMLLCAGTAVVESSVHEALEMHQASPGQPVLDPHSQGLTVDVTIHWGDREFVTEGIAHAN